MTQLQKKKEKKERKRRERELEEEVRVATASQKGQITIQKDLREEMNIKKGTKFALYREGDTIIMKKLELPTKEEFEELAEWGREYAEKKGIKKEDVLEGD